MTGGQTEAQAGWETGTESVTLPGNLSGAHSGAGTELNIKHGGLRSEGSSSGALKSGFSCEGKDPATGTGFTVGPPIGMGEPIDMWEETAI